MGRHREFDVDEALDAAMAVFWRKGYEGASYTDLTQATGVERPALYAAFGNKEALFRLALQRYAERYATHVPEALNKPTAREVAEHYLRGAVALNTRFPDRPGCFVLNGALACSEGSEPVRQATIEARTAGHALLRQRFERAQQEGDLPGTSDCATLAAYLMAVAHGIAVQAKAGIPREVVQAVAEQALAGWPTGDRPPRG